MYTHLTPCDLFDSAGEPENIRRYLTVLGAGRKGERGGGLGRGRKQRGVETLVSSSEVIERERDERRHLSDLFSSQEDFPSTY